MFEDLVQCGLVSNWHETVQLCDIMDLLISIDFEWEVGKCSNENRDVP
jgi:hypothetical protein